MDLNLSCAQCAVRSDRPGVTVIIETVAWISDLDTELVVACSLLGIVFDRYCEQVT